MVNTSNYSDTKLQDMMISAVGKYDAVDYRDIFPELTSGVECEYITQRQVDDAFAALERAGRIVRVPRGYSLATGDVAQVAKHCYVAFNKVTGQYWNGKAFSAHDEDDAARLKAHELSVLSFTYDNVKTYRLMSRYTMAVSLQKAVAMLATAHELEASEVADAARLQIEELREVIQSLENGRR